MKAKQHLSELPNFSFLMERKYFHFEEFNHLVCLLTFGYYNVNGELVCVYHLLLDNIFVRSFTTYLSAVEHLSKLSSF